MERLGRHASSMAQRAPAPTRDRMDRLNVGMPRLPSVRRETPLDRLHKSLYCRPLNLIGMPYYTEPLLSGSAILNTTSTYFPPPAKIPETVLQSMKTIDFVGYATLPRELRGQRNVAPKEPAPKDEGRFRSKVKRAPDPDEVYTPCPLSAHRLNS